MLLSERVLGPHGRAAHAECCRSSFRAAHAVLLAGPPPLVLLLRGWVPHNPGADPNRRPGHGRDGVCDGQWHTDPESI